MALTEEISYLIEMHFFYLDETGCNGANLQPGQEPIFVLGGLSVKDQGWIRTTEAVETVLSEYFGEDGVPEGFELHAHELLSPNGEGPFAGHERDRRSDLALNLLGLLSDRGHPVHYVAIDKASLANEADGLEHEIIDAKIPYLLAFDYLTTSMNEYVKSKLGRTVRGMTIIDEKPEFEEQIANLARFMRFKVTKAHRLKWLVEFSYSVDSKNHPFIQLSDLIIFCVKKFYEMDRGYREGWPAAAKAFYAQAFEKIHERTATKAFVSQSGMHAARVNQLMQSMKLKPRHGWKNHYGIE